MSVSIYALCDPRTGEARYVGKAVDYRERLATHLREARAGIVLHSRQWIAGLLKIGEKPELVVLEQVESNQEANEAERFWIAGLRLAGANLTNRTPGGDGQPKGCKRTPEAVERGAVKLRGKRRTPEQRANYRAAFNRPEERERRRRRVEELKKNPEWLAKVRYGRTGQPCSDETKRKISEARKRAPR